MMDEILDEAIPVRGFARLRIVEHGDDGMPKIVGESGWQKNRVVNEGYDNYLTRLLSAQAQSVQIGRMMLGTGALPATDATALPGELPLSEGAATNRQTVSVSVVSSNIVEFQATWASSDSHITASAALSNIGLINNTTTGGSIFAGITYTSSQWNTNQDVNASYRITFSQA